MKRQKGFTLIELLAVIVILAIIALIATPMIMDVIDKARKGSAESSAYGYIQAVEDQNVYAMVDASNAISAGFHPVSELNGKVSLKGEAPSEGWVYVSSKGIVEAASIKFKSYGSAFVGYTVEKHAKATVKDATLDGKLTVTADDVTITDNTTTTIEDIITALNSQM